MSSTSGLAELLRLYAFGYTAAHNFAVSDQVMADDYVPRMGPHEVRGRVEQYQPATRRQYEQFPTLGFTVHQLLCTGDRAALHFTEHGRSAFTGTLSSWQGVSLYRWNGERLTECRVEQDYHSRRRQLDSGVPEAVLPPGIDPWSNGELGPDPSAERQVREWLTSNEWATDPTPRRDDGSARPVLDDPTTEVLDLFGSGTQVAFHLRCTGAYAGGIAGTDDLLGRDVDLYASGIVTPDPETGH